MAAKTKRRKRPGFTLPIAVVAGALPGVTSTIGAGIIGGPAAMGQHAAVIYTGLDPNTGQWNLRWMMKGTGALLVGVGIHKLASMLGVNRALARARVPIFRL